VLAAWLPALIVFAVAAVVLTFINGAYCHSVERQWDASIAGNAKRMEATLAKRCKSRLMQPSGGMHHSRLRRMVYAGGDPDEPGHRDRARPGVGGQPVDPGTVRLAAACYSIVFAVVFSAIAFGAGDAIIAAYSRTRYRLLDRRQRRTRGPHVQHVRWPNADRYRHEAARPRFSPREIKTPPSNRAGCFVFCNVAEPAARAGVVLSPAPGETHEFVPEGERDQRPRWGALARGKHASRRVLRGAARLA
jgi:hypothetical protein